MPEEMLHFELMRYMGWSWQELEVTPHYVREYCWDLMNARLTAEQEAQERANSKS